MDLRQLAPAVAGALHTGCQAVKAGPLADGRKELVLQSGSTSLIRIAATDDEWRAALATIGVAPAPAPTPAPVPPPVPVPTPPPAPGPTKLLFAKQMLETPDSWTDLEEQAAKLDILVLQHWETAFLKRAKAANPKIKVLAYQNATYARLTDPNRPTWSSTGLDLASAQKLLYATSLQNGFNLNLCDITKPGYAQAWTTAVLARLQGLGFDGIYLDDFNVEAVSPSLPPGVSASQWADALTAFVQLLRTRTSGQYLLMANMNGTWGQHPAITPLLDSLDGGYDEFSLTWPAGNAVSQGFVDNALAAMATARSKGKAYIANTVATSATDTKRALAGYCLALIGGASHYSVVENYSAGYGTPTIDLPQFAIDVGDPVPGTFTKSGTVYRRQFSKATVSVDVASLTGTITT